MSAPTRLESALAEGRFAVTSEMGPPKSADPSVIAEKARLLGPVTDAVNITDNQTAQSRMCPLASGRIALVHAGASGVGTAAIQLCRAIGARVVVTASAAKLDAWGVSCRTPT